MYPDGRTNPTPAHFAKNTPVEVHPPASLRLLRQRGLDREGRAICRIVYAHGIGIQCIAGVFCVSDETVIQAIENKPSDGGHDKAENDYWYVSSEFKNQYPSMEQEKPELKALGTASGTTAIFVYQYFSPAFHRNPPGTPRPERQAALVLDFIYDPRATNCVRQPQIEIRQIASYTVRKDPTIGGIAKPHPPALATGAKPREGSSMHKDGLVPTEDNNNPTCRHFKDNRPVEKAGTSGDLPRLDREGRAICRIMYPHIGSYTRIAAIFGITHTRVRRAVLNQYSPPDDITDDYDYAGQEFKQEYPPISEKSSSSNLNKRQISPELGDVELPTNKRSRKNEAPSAWGSADRKVLVVEVPARTKMDPGAVGVGSFLKNIGGFDLSRWQETFREKGLRNMGDLSTLAGLDERRLVKTLNRLFADQKMAEVHILLLADALLDLAKDVA
ncbi:hypothetical protein B0H10DRAFT_2029059 [Mycena sp. CBHHK59/15]|nr:hypothetical protein B0H10DRAFT_2029059 [Mycena sp. CBHHK59/15]